MKIKDVKIIKSKTKPYVYIDKRTKKEKEEDFYFDRLYMAQLNRGLEAKA